MSVSESWWSYKPQKAFVEADAAVLFNWSKLYCCGSELKRAMMALVAEVEQSNLFFGAFLELASFKVVERYSQ